MRSSPDRWIDLNADVGEGAEDAPLYETITSANIACGGHAGDHHTMQEAVARALRRGVAIGAHPSYPDRARFGRVSMALPADVLAGEIAAQVGALADVASSAGAVLAHVKAHGALYNDAAVRTNVADAVARGVGSLSPSLPLFGLAGSKAIALWRARGLAVVEEGFADRGYDPGGALLPRSVPGAVLADPAAAADQAVRLAEGGRCGTICVHSDTPGAVAIASAVRQALERAGFTVRARGRS